MPPEQLLVISCVGIKISLKFEKCLSNVMIMHVEVLELGGATQIDRITTSHEPQVYYSNI